MEKSIHETSSISSFVTNFFLILGLSAEFFSIKFVISNAGLGYTNLDYIFIFSAVTMMLFHQFLIFRNFHILDHIPSNELKVTLGDWVEKCRIEDVIRFLIFIAFAFLTGEVVYLKSFVSLV